MSEEYWPASNTTDEGSNGAVGGALELAIVVRLQLIDKNHVLRLFLH